MKDFRKAQIEVSKVKRSLGNTGSKNYYEVTPSKINYKPAIFTFFTSFMMIAGVFAGMYYFL